MAKRYFDSSSRQKPGVISQDLRRALNIHSDKLPIWIYRMRVLGYPPGWLQQAKVSTLAIFNDDAEDGEVKELPEAHVQEYNKESLIEYPGFNTPVPEGIRDDWYMLGMPPMMPTQQLNEALKTMKVSEPVPYKKAKLDASFTGSSPSTSASTSTPKPQQISLNPNSNDSTPIESSLTPIKANDTNSNDSKEDLKDNTSVETPSKPSDISLNMSTDSERKLKLISMGSPMPASERPKRPSLDKWAVGMGELIYFENPNTEYTGNYKKKIKGVIDKIRQKNSQN